MIYFVLILNVILLFFAFNSKEENTKWEIIIAEAISTLVGIYFVTTGLLWLFKIYSITLSMIAVTTVCCGIFAVLLLLNKDQKNILKISSISVNYKWLISRVVIVLSCILSLGSYSILEIGRNDGNNLTQALFLLNGNNSLNYEIPEYEQILPDSKYSLYFEKSIADLDKDNFSGKYWKSEKEIVSTESEHKGETKIVSALNGSFGSDVVYASFLSCAMELFGVEKVSYVNVFLIFCTLIFMDSILGNIRCKWKTRTLLVALMGISPLLIYASHTAFYESVVMFCIVAFLYFLICKSGKQKILAALFVVAASFVGVSIYPIIPVLIVICWIKFIFDKEYEYLVCSILISVGYGIAFLLLLLSAYDNTLIVYKQGLFFLNDIQVVITVYFGVVLSLLLSIILWIFYKDDYSEKIRIFIHSQKVLIIKTVFLIIPMTSVIVTVVKGIQSCDSWKDATSLSLVVAATVSGVIIIPTILFGIIKMNYRITSDNLIMLIFFEYGVFVYAALLRPTVGELYLEARFLLPFLPAIIGTSGIIMKEYKKDNYFIPLIAIIILFLPYSATVINNKTDSANEWQIVLNVMETVKENSEEDTIVLVEKSLMNDFYFPLKSIKELKVYPYDKKIKRDFAKSVDVFGKKVIYVTKDKSNAYKRNERTLYSESNHLYGVNKKDYSPLIGIPMSYSLKKTQEIQVMEINDFSDIFNVTDCKDGDFSYELIDFNVKDIKIENEIATIKLGITEEKPVLYSNSSQIRVSYHLSFDNKEKNIFENARWEIGSGQYINSFPLTVEIDLSQINDDNVIVTLDAVEEYVEWYSKNHIGCPMIQFMRNANGWDYKIEQ